MKPLHIFRVCLCLVVLFALSLSLAACGVGRNNPWMSPDQGQVLAEKVKTNRNAYLRFTQAEEEARKDGNSEAIEHYARAREAARQSLDRSEQELAAYQSAKGVKADKTRP
jgi:hypothetical protein